MRKGLATTISPTLAVLAMATPLRAQPASVEWTAVSRIESGDCESGAAVQVLELPGSMRLRFHVNNMQSPEVTIPLAGDGSGRGEFRGKVPHAFANIGKLVRNEHDIDENRGVFGREIVHVPPGTGKRPLESRQSRNGGDCHWIWVPK